MSRKGESDVPFFAIYGASGCGRGVMPVARQLLQQCYGTEAYRLVFVDDGCGGTTVNGHRVVDYATFLSFDASAKHVCIAIADSEVRERLTRRCERDRVGSFDVTAPNALIMDDVELGAGAFVAPFVTLTSNIRIGRGFHANLYSYVEHDCVIGDFVTFAPSVRCNGNVVIEDHAYLGSGCILRQGRPGRPLVIGRGAVVGMGAVVTKDVSPGTTVAGNPARPLD
mgnify:CR=1 FL=1